MDSVGELAKLLPPEGPWRIVVFAVIAGVSFLPRVTELWREHRSRRHHYEGLKNRLEIVRLRYEIESLRRAHNLTALATPAENELLSGPLSPVTPPRQRLSVLSRGLWTMTGGGLFFLLITLVAVFDSEEDFQTTADITNWLLGGLFLATAGSLPGALVPATGKGRSILLGFVSVFLVMFLIAGAMTCAGAGEL